MINDKSEQSRGFMTTARKDFMQADKIGTYHITVRCVRRSFLQGFDDYSGKDYSHRKTWIPDKVNSILKAFAIDVASYAIISSVKNTFIAQ